MQEVLKADPRRKSYSQRTIYLIGYPFPCGGDAPLEILAKEVI